MQQLAEYHRNFNIFFVVDWAGSQKDFSVPQTFDSDRVCFLVCGSQNVKNTHNCTQAPEVSFTLGMLYERLATQVLLFTSDPRKAEFN